MILKRLFDVAVSFAVLVLLAPLLLAIALAVKLETRGAVFCEARRVGRGGHPFRLYRFRTTAGAGCVERDAASLGTPKMTRLGRWLRRARLDELPQLINVLKGDMSLVGPMPEAPEYVRIERSVWRQVLSVRPGICGPAQLVFAEVDLPPDRDYATRILPVKLHLDLSYVRRQSLLLDLRVLGQIVLSLIRPGWRAPIF